MRTLAVFVATVGYAGLFPFAPGTVGSLVGLAVYAAIAWSHRGGGAELVTILVLFTVGVWAATVAEHHFGREDPGEVIVDEVAGMLITLLLVPVSVTGAVVGFVTFRVFDVIKPFPASRFERLHGGLGVMSDDVMAAVYANMTLRLLSWLIPEWII